RNHKPELRMRVRGATTVPHRYRPLFVEGFPGEESRNPRPGRGANLLDHPEPLAPSAAGWPRKAWRRSLRSGPNLEGFFDLLASEESREQGGESTGVEAVTASHDLADRPPPESEVVLVLEVDPLRPVDRGAQSGQPDHYHLLVLQPA